MRDLAARALVSRSRLTHTVDRLVTRGYVCRKACEHDRRGVVAVLTADGRSLLEAAAPTHVEDVRRLLVDQLPRGGARSLVRTLQPVLDRMTDGGG
jgi:DNA-binding MarR family transcriptional regulator